MSALPFQPHVLVCEVYIRANAPYNMSDLQGVRLPVEGSGALELLLPLPCLLARQAYSNAVAQSQCVSCYVSTGTSPTWPTKLFRCGGVLAACPTFAIAGGLKHYQAVCVVKTGSTRSYVTSDLLHLLGQEELHPGSETVQINIHGKRHQFYLSNLNDVCILGTDWLGNKRMIVAYGPTTLGQIDRPQ